VTNRIDRLVETGVIVRFTARIRDEGDPHLIRAVSLIEVEGRTTDSVIKALRGMPEISALHTTNGDWDLVAELSASSLAEFDPVLGQIRLTKGVVNSETSLLLSSVLR
jgi:DNA-binding Lrp family transcriptional regulator